MSKAHAFLKPWHFSSLQAAVSDKPPCFTATNAQVLLPGTVNASQLRDSVFCSIVFQSSLFVEDTPTSVSAILQPVLNLPTLKLLQTNFSTSSLALKLPLYTPRPWHVPALIPVWLWLASLVQENSSLVTFPVKGKVCLLPPLLWSREGTAGAHPVQPSAPSWSSHTRLLSPHQLRFQCQ